MEDVNTDQNKVYMNPPIKLKPKIILKSQQPAQPVQMAAPAFPLAQQPIAQPQVEPSVRLATFDDLIRGGWITSITIKNEYGKMKAVALLNGNDMQLTAYGYSFDEVLRNMKEYVLAQRIEL